MKISALASLLGVSATLLPVVSASESESSLRGTAIIPSEVDLLELGINCGSYYPDKCYDIGENTCYRVVTQCSNICDCEIDYATEKCVKGTCVGAGEPVPSPSPPQRENCRVGAGDCANNQWCSTSRYGQCNGGQGQCSYFLGGGTCPMDHSPVCGCDGVTYSNECLATNAGVNVDYAGSCSGSCQVGQKNACPSGQWCRAFSSNSDQCGGQGQCSYYLGGACPANYDPVCGCDGNTYGNSCAATNAGVNVDYTGACSNSDCGISHTGQSDCPSGQWCRALSPGCLAGSPGTCIHFSGRCNTDNNPVCGCDWVNYANECQAAAAGMNIQYYGECQ